MWERGRLASEENFENFQINPVMSECSEWENVKGVLDVMLKQVVSYICMAPFVHLK